jgi:hypothetical protein
MDRGHRFVHVRRLAATAVIVAFLTTVFVPAIAAQAQSANSNVFSSKSIEKAVANHSATSKAVEAPKTPKQATKTGSFFKTRTGVLVLAIMAVGTGYALYSVKEDRIKGSTR